MSEQNAEKETRNACACGHAVWWHHDTRGCGYKGFSPDHRCSCMLLAHEAVEQVVNAAKADGVRLGIEYVESFQADYANGGHALSADGALHALNAALSSLPSAVQNGDDHA